jgi:3-oxoacyl-[acyl-carrier protein] reductase
MGTKDKIIGKIESILVTGATGGVGNAILEVLLEEGYNIIATDISMDRLVETKKQMIYKLGISDQKIDIIEFDLRRVECIEFFIDSIKKCLNETKHLWGFVNNAAIYLPSSRRSLHLTEIVLEDIIEIVNVNMIAAFLISREVFKILREGKRGGSIIFISSLAGKKGSLLNPIYGMTKAALTNLAKSIAHEGGRENIRANAISPGIIETKMGLEAYPSKDRLEERIKKNLIQRVCTPKEVAYLVKYLLSETSGFMTGADLDLSGGALIK